jgi:hypothetical protein
LLAKAPLDSKPCSALTCFARADKGVAHQGGDEPPRPERFEPPPLSHILIVLAVVAFLFRKPLGRIFARQFPNRAKRQQVLATVIAGFLIVIAIRLLALFW